VSTIRLFHVGLLVTATATLIACGELFGIDDDEKTTPIDASVSQTTDGTVGSDVDPTGDGSPSADAAPPPCTKTDCAETLGGVVGPAIRILVQDDYIYVVSGPKGGASRLHRLRASGAPSGGEITPNEAVSGSLVTNPSGAAWGTYGGLRFLAHDAGGDASKIVNSTNNISAVAFLSGNTVIFGRYDVGDGGTIWSCELPQCGNVSFWQLATHMTELTFIDDGKTQVHIAQPSISEFPRLYIANAIADAASPTDPAPFANDGKAAYLATEEGLFKITSSGVSPIFSTTPPERVRGVTTDGPNKIVFAQKGSMFRCTLVGTTCNREEVMQGPYGINDVAVTPTHYYWVTNNGGIHRVARY
jgi:hypothetical protein